jgi:hypothetical protein
MNDDRKRQVATRKKRHGENTYSRMARDRLMKLTPEERSELARRAVTKRYHPEWTDEQITKHLIKEEK